MYWVFSVNSRKAINALSMKVQYLKNLVISKEIIYLGHFTKDDKLCKRELVSLTIQSSGRFWANCSTHSHLGRLGWSRGGEDYVKVFLEPKYIYKDIAEAISSKKIKHGNLLSVLTFSPFTHGAFLRKCYNLTLKKLNLIQFLEMPKILTIWNEM